MYRYAQKIYEQNIVTHIQAHNTTMLIKSNLFEVKRMIIRTDHDHSAIIILFHDTLILPALLRQTVIFKYSQNVFIHLSGEALWEWSVLAKKQLNVPSQG